MVLLTLSMALAADPKIIEGSDEAGWPQVVSLGAGGGEYAISGCTGTLITPRLVLSAAHCGAEFSVEAIVALGSAYFGEWVGDPDHQLGFSDAVIHPDYVPLENPGGFGGQELGEYDVALFELDEDAPVQALRYEDSALTEALEGETVLSVGYGLTERNESGHKHSAPLTVDRVEEMFLVSYSDTNDDGANICSGDSGGPMIQESDGLPRVVGVHSWGDNNCRSSSGSTRVDLVSDWIRSNVLEVHGTMDLCHVNDRYSDGACDPDCLAPDPDCFEETAGGVGCDARGRQGGLIWVMALVLGLGRIRQGPSGFGPGFIHS